MTQFQGFDPLKFLGVTNLKDEEKNTISEKLLSKISQYLLIRIVELLPEGDVKKLNDTEAIFIMAKGKIPDLSTKVKLFLEDFKEEFYKNIKV